MKPAQRLAMLTNLPTRSELTFGDHVVEAEVDVFHGAVGLGGEVVAQPLGVELCSRYERAVMKVPRLFDILAPSTVRKPFTQSRVGVAVAGELFSIAGQNSGVK